eukprot:g449.t1
MTHDRNDAQNGPSNQDGGPAPVIHDPETDRDAPLLVEAKFPIGLPVRHRRFGFHGVIFDVDPEFDNTEEWYQSIPEEVRPRKDQPFYHLLAVNPQDQSPYVAYVSEQNLEASPEDDGPFHPAVADLFDGMAEGRFVPRNPYN